MDLNIARVTIFWDGDGYWLAFHCGCTLRHYQAEVFDHHPCMQHFPRIKKEIKKQKEVANA